MRDERLARVFRAQPIRVPYMVLLSAGAANGTLDRTPIKRGDGSDIDIVTRAPIADAAVTVFVNLGCNTVGGFTAYARV